MPSRRLCRPRRALAANRRATIARRQLTDLRRHKPDNSPESGAQSMTIRDALKRTVRQIRDALTGFDAGWFDDPIAEQTQWSIVAQDAKDSGAGSLIQATPERMWFRMAAPGWLKPALLAGAGLLLLIEATDVVALLVGASLCLFAVHVAQERLPPKVFDVSERMYWEGSQPPAAGTAANERGRHSCRLEDIYAIQLLWGKIYEYTYPSYYFSARYELNLVLRDASRINIVAYCNRERLREDGQRLADFLGVPLWDATRFGMGPQ
jgi:hypothetical protein